jgi:hypothetical protein
LSQPPRPQPGAPPLHPGGLAAPPSGRWWPPAPAGRHESRQHGSSEPARPPDMLITIAVSSCLSAQQHAPTNLASTTVDDRQGCWGTRGSADTQAALALLTSASAVCPCLVVAAGSAPAASSSRTFSADPARAAKCRGVQPSGSATWWLGGRNGRKGATHSSVVRSVCGFRKKHVLGIRYSAPLAPQSWVQLQGALKAAAERRGIGAVYGLALGSAPCLSRSCVMLTGPRCAAVWRQLRLSRLALFGLG